MIALSQSDLRSLFPKGSPALLGDIAERAPLVLGPIGVLDKPERLAHFLAQASAETGGLSRVVESLRYSARRIVEVFGPGVHSARIGAAEARRLAGDEYALGERVYGLGNPKKASELGNVERGDGFAFRGRGYIQITGRYNYARFGEIIGEPLENDPDRASDLEPALEIAAAYWSARRHQRGLRRRRHCAGDKAGQRRAPGLAPSRAGICAAGAAHWRHCRQAD